MQDIIGWDEQSCVDERTSSIWGCKEANKGRVVVAPGAVEKEEKGKGLCVCLLQANKIILPPPKRQP
jgi:hypothetical protein